MNIQLTEAMAGNGNPRAALTPFRKQILYLLHKHQSVNYIENTLLLSREYILSELQPLVDYNLLEVTDHGVFPAFFMATKEEVEYVLQESQALATRIATYLEEQWGTFSAQASRLLAQNQVFQERAFFLIGDRLLDIGLLDALTLTPLMPPAPRRPSVLSPDDRYYLWMIEGMAEQRGKYGQRATQLSMQNWYLFTFGEYSIQGKLNTERLDVEQNAQQYIANNPNSSVVQISSALRVDFYTREFCVSWDKAMFEYSVQVVTILMNYERQIRSVYANTASSRYYKTGFSEFICWYIHVVYAQVIDMLAELNLVAIPSSRFSAVIWYEDIARKRF